MEGLNVWSIFGAFGLDTSDLEAGLKRTEDTAKRTADKVATDLERGVDKGVEGAKQSVSEGMQALERLTEKLGGATSEAAKEVADVAEASVEAVTKAAQEGTTKVTDFVGGAMDRIQGFGRGVQAVGGFLTTFVSIPLASAVTGIMALANNAKATADQLEVMSTRTGLSAERLRELQYAAQMSNTNVGDIAMSAMWLARQLATVDEEGSRVAGALDTLGVSAKGADGNLRSMDDLLPSVLEALADTEDVTVRNAAAYDLFGRASTNLLPLLSKSGEELRGLRQEAHDVGFVLSGEALDGAKAYGEQMDRVKLALQGAKDTLALSVAPVAEQFAAFARDHLVPILTTLASRVERLGAWFTSLDESTQRMFVNVTLALAVGGPLILGLGTLIANLQTIIGLFQTLGVLGGLMTGPAGWITLAAIAFGALAVSLASGETDSVATAAEDAQKALASGDRDSLLGALDRLIEFTDGDAKAGWERYRAELVRTGDVAVEQGERMATALMTAAVDAQIAAERLRVDSLRQILSGMPTADISANPARDVDKMFADYGLNPDQFFLHQGQWVPRVLDWYSSAEATGDLPIPGGNRYNALAMLNAAWLRDTEAVIQVTTENAAQREVVLQELASAVARLDELEAERAAILARATGGAGAGAGSGAGGGVPRPTGEPEPYQQPPRLPNAYASGSLSLFGGYLQQQAALRAQARQEAEWLRQWQEQGPAAWDAMAESRAAGFYESLNLLYPTPEEREWLRQWRDQGVSEWDRIAEERAVGFQGMFGQDPEGVAAWEAANQAGLDAYYAQQNAAWNDPNRRAARASAAGVMAWDQMALDNAAAYERVMNQAAEAQRRASAEGVAAWNALADANAGAYNNAEAYVWQTEEAERAATEFAKHVVESTKDLRMAEDEGTQGTLTYLQARLDAAAAEREHLELKQGLGEATHEEVQGALQAEADALQALMDHVGEGDDAWAGYAKRLAEVRAELDDTRSSTEKLMDALEKVAQDQGLSAIIDTAKAIGQAIADMAFGIEDAWANVAHGMASAVMSIVQSLAEVAVAHYFTLLLAAGGAAITGNWTGLAVAVAVLIAASAWLGMLGHSVPAPPGGGGSRPGSGGEWGDEGPEGEYGRDWVYDENGEPRKTTRQEKYAWEQERRAREQAEAERKSAREHPERFDSVEEWLTAGWSERDRMGMTLMQEAQLAVEFWSAKAASARTESQLAAANVGLRMAQDEVNRLRALGLVDEPGGRDEPSEIRDERFTGDEVTFGRTPQSVQYAVATPLVEASSMMMQAATLMRDSFATMLPENGFDALPPFTAALTDVTPVLQRIARDGIQVHLQAQPAPGNIAMLRGF